MRRKISYAVLVMVCLVPVPAISADGARGMPRTDLVGKRWSQLPPTQYPDFGLPLPWKIERKLEFRLFHPEFSKYIATIIELPRNDSPAEVIVAALDLTALKEGEWPEHDCFYMELPSCDGMLCDGLLIGVISKNAEKEDGTYIPSEVWEITSNTLEFKKVNTKNVICKPQSYAD